MQSETERYSANQSFNFDYIDLSNSEEFFYDIIIDIQAYNYLLDIELKNDFLISSSNLRLLQKGPNGKYKRVAESKWYNDETTDDFTSVPLTSQHSFVQRIRFMTELNDDEL